MSSSAIGLKNALDDVDAVVTWVDGADPNHRRKRRRFQSGADSLHERAVADRRYSDNGELRLCLRSLYNFAPWLRTIWLITDEQIPTWLDVSAAERAGIRFINHATIFKGYEEFLPTFNSLSIEAMMWRFDGLAERFIYFNDDMFLTGAVKKSDFFAEDKVYIRSRREDFSQRKINFYLSGLINAEKMLGIPQEHHLTSKHVTYAMLKGVLAELFDRFRPEFIRNASFRFRDTTQFQALALHDHHALLTDRAILKLDDDTAHFPLKLCEKGSADEIRLQLAKLASPTVIAGCINYAEAAAVKVPELLSRLEEVTGPLAPFEKENRPEVSVSRHASSSGRQNRLSSGQTELESSSENKTGRTTVTHVNFVYVSGEALRPLEEEFAAGISAELPNWTSSSSIRRILKGSVNVTFFIYRRSHVMMSHGLGDKNYLLRPNPEGDLEINKYRFVCVPGEWTRRKLLALPGLELRPDQIRVVGWPRIDRLKKHVLTDSKGTGSDASGQRAKPKLLWAPTLADRAEGPPLSSYPGLLPYEERLNDIFDYRVSLHPSLRKNGTPTFEALLEADVVVADSGTLVYEAWALNKPVIFPSWLTGPGNREKNLGSAENYVYRHGIGMHAQSFDELVDMALAARAPGSDVNDFMRDYLSPEAAGKSYELLAGIVAEVADSKNLRVKRRVAAVKKPP